MAAAQRIIEERFETSSKIKTVGFHVKLADKRVMQPGSINFCTPKIFLHQLQLHPDAFLEGVSHIFVDEIHTRKPEMDILMALLKEMVSKLSVQIASR